MKPEVIFFDAAGTLIYLPESVGEHYRRVAETFDVRLDTAALNAAFHTAWSAAPPRPAMAGPRPDDDKGWWRALVFDVLARVPSGSERPLEPEQFFEAAYAHFAQPGVWAVYPDVRPGLQELLTRGYRLGVISNFDRRLRPVLDQLGLGPLFEHIILSSEVGADKPDPRIFEQALASFQISSHRALHVGDDPKRDWGATAAGLSVFRLQRPEHTLNDVLASLNER